jgi:hypothetical protein
MSRLITVDTTNECCSSLDDDNTYDDNDEFSDNTNDESIFSRSSWRVDVINIAEDDGVKNGGGNFSPRDHSETLAATPKRLGIKNQKPLNKYATTDVFEHGRNLMSKNLHKTNANILRKLERKQYFIREAVRYFASQMAKRQELLERCSLCSSDHSTQYYQPSWKVQYKSYVQFELLY